MIKNGTIILLRLRPMLKDIEGYSLNDAVIGMDTKKAIRKGIWPETEPQLDPPTLEEAMAEEAVLIQEMEAVQYKKDRVYPDIYELIDAQVKQRSMDPVLMAEGQAQEEKYYLDCLEVKNTFPKPI